jgi:CheY-like chemotaxis protein
MVMKRVLVVDDDLEFLQELKETLALSGYEVYAVNKAGNAINFASARRPDLILLDLKMGGMTGFEVAKGLRSVPQTANIPIIAMSGYFNEQKDCTLLEYFEIHHCLQKPFNPLDVISYIESTLHDAPMSS